jgi:hypothetical protein
MTPEPILRYAQDDSIDTFTARLLSAVFAGDSMNLSRDGKIR